MIKILCICHGNICRSATAEFVLKDMAAKAGLSDRFYIESAGTSDEEIWNGRGNPIYPPALKTLKEHGIGVKGNELGVAAKEARQTTKKDYKKFDLIIGMDKYNLRNMLSIYGGDPENKVSLLMDYTDRPRSVADPWYTGNFVDAWNDIYEGCSALFEVLKKQQAGV